MRHIARLGPTIVRATVLSALILLGGVFTYSTRQAYRQIVVVHEQGETVTRRLYPFVTRVHEIATMAKAIANDERGFLIHGDEEFAAEIRRVRVPRLKLAFANAKNVASFEQQARLDELESEIADWIEKLEEEFQLFRAHPESSRTMSFETTRPLRKRYEELIREEIQRGNSAVEDAAGRLDGALRASRQSFMAVMLLWVTLVVVSVPASIWIMRALRREEIDRAAHAVRAKFENQIVRGLEMSETEEAIFTFMGRAMITEDPDAPAEVLVADSSRAHFLRAIGTPAAGTELCEAPNPDACPAIRAGATLRFDSSESLDACQYLVGRPSGPCSALCVPLTIMGRSVGVLHAPGAPGLPPIERAHSLETLSRKAGERLGAVRSLQRSELRATTDPLTGLINRRSLEEQVHDLQLSRRSYAVAFADVDHFKKLNDTFGHPMGDRALRLFARVITSTLRDEDISCRYGGEEFVFVFPDARADAARLAAERLREALAFSLDSGSVSDFTVSFGVTESADGEDLASVVERADAALLEAKQAGRDRVVISSPPEKGEAPLDLSERQ